MYPSEARLLYRNVRYKAALHRDPDGAWRGQAESNQGHTLIVGDSPRVELSNSTLTLARTSFERSNVPNTYHPPRAETVSMFAGDAFEAVLQPGDVIRTSQTSTSEMAISMYRGDQLRMAFGAATGHLQDSGIDVQPDPRVEDDEFYGVGRAMRQPGYTLVWLDPDAAGTEAEITRLVRGSFPAVIKTVMIVIRSDDLTKAAALSQRLSSGPGRSWQPWFYYAPAGIRTRGEFNAYLDRLPGGRPTDLFLRFTIDGRQFELREGEYQARESWHLFVAEVQRAGFPGRSSRMGVAREDPALSDDAFMSSGRGVRYCCPRLVAESQD